MKDTPLERDEERRLAQHESVKEKLRNEVNIAVLAEGRSDIAERPEIAEAGRELEHRAVGEVVATEREVARTRKSARAIQIIDYVFFVIYALIAIEIVLEAVGARESNGFQSLMDTVTT